MGFIEVKFFDVIDILFISMLLYKLYFFVRGSRAAQMFVGLLLIFIISLLTRLFDMRGMTWMFDSLKTVWLIAFVIIFQPELRRMLIYVGQSRLIRYFVKVSSGRTFDEVVVITLHCPYERNQEQLLKRTGRRKFGHPRKWASLVHSELYNCWRRNIKILNPILAINGSSLFMGKAW